MFHKASSTEELEQLWGNYKINKAIPKIEFAESDVYFLGLEESSSCPYKIEQIEVGIKNMSIDLFSYEGDCTADASPRTFVIKLDKNSSNSLEKIELTIANEQTLLLLTSIK